MKRSTGAFTLIESLVVVLLISTLAAMLFPLLAPAKKAAFGASCAANLAQIGQATVLYAADADDRYPAGTDVVDANTRCEGMTRSTAPLVQDVMGPYTRSKEVWACPLDRGVPDVPAGSWEEAVECALPGTPTLWRAFGASYVYRSDFGREGVTVPATLYDAYGKGETHGPSEVPVFYDAYGLWHGSESGEGRRYTAVFADGHTKSVDRSTIAVAESWVTKPR